MLTHCIRHKAKGQVMPSAQLPIQIDFCKQICEREAKLSLRDSTSNYMIAVLHGGITTIETDMDS